MFKSTLKLQEGQAFTWIDLYNLCVIYGYSFDAIRVQNLIKRWTTDKIADDLGNELLKQFYSDKMPYQAYKENEVK